MDFSTIIHARSLAPTRPESTRLGAARLGPIHSSSANIPLLFRATLCARVYPLSCAVCRMEPSRLASHQLLMIARRQGTRTAKLFRSFTLNILHVYEMETKWNCVYHFCPFRLFRFAISQRTRCPPISPDCRVQRAKKTCAFFLGRSSFPIAVDACRC